MAHMLTEHMIQEELENARKGEVIHSGHFMISSVADQEDEDDEITHDRDSPVHHDQAIRLREGYDFSEVRKETQNTYQFGHRPTNHITIDASLSRLFKCMSLAYQGGKVVSPKWKNFKGMRLTVKDKIRLNNAIWRTWHIQYIMRRRRSKLSFVQFATPLDNESDCDSHSKPEAVVMEGKYWKRRIETVVAEYKKWRAFFMDKWVSHHSPTTSDMSAFDLISKGDDATMMDFTDRLFSCLSQPFQFPNPREIAQHATNSDMMQPGLLQLQPMIEEFMDSDALHDIFSPIRKSPSVNGNNASLFYPESTLQPPHTNSFGSIITTHDMNANAVQEASLEELVQRATADQDVTGMSISQPDMGLPHLQTRHQEMPQMMQHSNLNLGVTDPVLSSATSVHGKVFNRVQMHSAPTMTAMMRSKKQPDTPTISQVVTAHTSHHHNHGTTYDQSKVQAAMPPPQKKAPRRRSSGKSPNNAGMNLPTVSTTMSPVVVPQGMKAQQQTMNSTLADTSTMLMNYSTMPQMGQVTSRTVQVQPQQNPAMSSAVPRVIVTLQNSFSLQPIIDQKRGFEQSMQQSSRNVQTGCQDVIINSMNANTQLNNMNRRKDIRTIFVPVSLQHSMPNQGIMSSFSQTPVTKQIQMQTTQISNVHVVQKPVQSSSSQQGVGGQTLLTQLLTQGRHIPPNRTSSSLQPPPNKSLPLTKQVQIRKVQEQAANFNDFQNSVVFAAAQLANAPPLPPSLPTGQQLQTQLQPFVVPASSTVDDKDESPVVTNTTPMSVNGMAKSFPPLRSPGSPTKRRAEKDMSCVIAKWAAMLPVQSNSMETEESPFPDAVMSDSNFATTLEKSAYNSATSPASSTASSTSEQKSMPFTAEQKRRCNIKTLCDRLQEILPDGNKQANSKISKAVLLNKSCNYIKQLQSVRQQTGNEIQQLRKKIDALNEDISNFQQQLPATGAPVCRHRGDRMRQVFEDWVRDRTLHNWKFFIFSMIIQTWFTTYDQSVSVANLEEMCRTCLLWLEKHCALPSLRRSVVDSLKKLSTTTSILSDPTTLQQQAETAVKQSSRHSSSSSS